MLVASPLCQPLVEWCCSAPWAGQCRARCPTRPDRFAGGWCLAGPHRGRDDHKVMAFQLGAELMKLKPELARQAVTDAWPKLKTRYAKTGLLKAFQFGGASRGAGDPASWHDDADPEVRQYADHYLSMHSFRSSLLARPRTMSSGIKPMEQGRSMRSTKRDSSICWRF